MNFRGKGRDRSRVGLFWSLAAAAVLGLSLVLLLQAQAAPGRARPAQDVVRERIGLPTVGTMALQYINRLGLLEPTSTTINIVASDGTPLERVVEPAAPPESVLVYNAPERLDDLARIEYEHAPDGGNLVFGVDYQLLPSGNSGYLGLEMTQRQALPTTAASPAQPTPYELHIMLLMKRYGSWSSSFVLQNREVDAAANLLIYYYDAAGVQAGPSMMADVPPGGSRTIILEYVDYLPSDFYGSAVVVSDQPLAVSSVQNYNLDDGLRCAYQGIGTEETATRLVAPALFNDHDLQVSAMCIANAQDSPTEVTVEYSDGITAETVVAARASWCLYQIGEGHAAGWAGGATIDASQPVAAVVQVQAYDQSTLAGCWAYTATPLASAGDTLAFPLVARDMGGWTSDVLLYNPTTAPVQVTPRYVSYPDGRVHCLDPVTVGGGDSLSLAQKDLPDSFGQGMAYLVSTGPLGGAVRFSSAQARSAGDRHFGYEAAHVGSEILLPDTCSEMHTVYLPLLLK